ncbi:exocyst complex component Sec10-domain-containing protein [Epithele typhae]|uniref:exocyst complex component Sec10-domain-containing protein n=1 Tax=Epithele typhae TaxID=378194 RepID=UPI002007684E|nr:exocyst complex component Sec10-domain-containing protein [Epithele typhae]KAH9942244.1 exocyst complex component Sec10-domain-containing protein [Epithele typhae]
MDKFTTLEPVRLHNAPVPTPHSARPSSNRFSFHRPAAAAPTHVRTKSYAPFQLIGRLPVDLHILVLTYLAVPDICAYARVNRALGNLAKDDRVWDARWKAFAIDKHKLSPVLDSLEHRLKVQNGLHRNDAPPTLAAESLDDDFGDFASIDAQAGEMGDFVGAFSMPTPRTPAFVLAGPQAKTSRALYMRAHSLLLPLIPALSAPPHAVLSKIFPSPAPPLRDQAHTLRLLSIFLSHTVKPLRHWETLSVALRAGIDRFEDGLLTAFDVADGKDDETAMREAAEASWEVWDGTGGEWELGKVWAEKREIFYEQSKWKPLDNFNQDSQLDFDAMDEFIADILAALEEHGARAVRVFPAEANVLVSFADRLANEVVGDYITSLLTRAREISNAIFLQATAASFKESWRIVDTIIKVGSQGSNTPFPKTQAEDVVYRMFEQNMDEYLDEEVEFVKQSFEMTCRSWEKQLSEHRIATDSSNADHARFLGSHNPAQVKRTVLASFTDVLLLPVTIVPRTVGAVGAAITTGGNAAVQGIQMLNPQRWVGPGINTGAFPFARPWNANEKEGYVRNFDKDNGMLFDIGPDDDDEPEVLNEKQSTPRSSLTVSVAESSASTAPTSVQSTRVSTPNPGATLDKLDLLLSLDIGLELIQADRESLKRAETFAGYPGSYGHRVRDTMEELFVLLLISLGERHIKPGFETATERMKSYKPSEHDETKSVAPLLQFFELVHAPHIDRTDFLNTVVREKKRFEDILDDSVAAGLNAATDALMNQVEHIIQKLTKPREYYPSEDTPLELGATEGCREAIKCLQMHCQLLKGSTSKEVLEVFYQEVGIRLIAILQKHIKRQIISLSGGFLIIADLNAYQHAKDLAQIVRDVTRYGGAYRPEDIYEFIQRRSDWKKIEKTVDKTMYNLSFKEDCVIS